MTKRPILSVAFLGLAIAVTGCSANKLAPAKVSGSVTYQGKPVTGGSMAFHTPEGVEYSAQLGADGTYSATDIPEGELVVTVSTESLNPARKAAEGGKDTDRRMKATSGQQPPAGVAAASPETKGVYVKIPEKYGNAKTSTATVKVTSGRQVHNIELD